MKNEISTERAKQAIVEVLRYIGENPERPGLVDTPERMLRMFDEMFRGYRPDKAPKITTFANGRDGIVYDNMVVDKGDFYSVCEHHCRTFFGEYIFAYIPNPKGRILGLSKIGRVVDYCSSKLQVQERLVSDVVTMLSEALGEENPPLGMAMMMRGRHMCKESRGARKKGLMTSSCLTGIFREDSDVRREFLAICNQAGV